MRKLRKHKGKHVYAQAIKMHADMEVQLHPV